LNEGRVEFTFSYTVASGLVLLVVFVILLAFRLGQKYGNVAERPASPAVSENNLDARAGSMRAALPNDELTPAAAPRRSTPEYYEKPVEPGNAIVIQQYHAVADLVPVKRYFADHGIETEIVRSGDDYFLVTVERFSENPNNPGTQGYRVKQRIVELGKNYRAEPGRESFAPNYFKDAYGRKFEDDFKGEIIDVR